LAQRLTLLRTAALVILAGIAMSGEPHAAKAAERAPQAVRLGASPRIIISTDVATGLIDTHGGKSLTPVPFGVTHAYTTDTNVSPQDIDDGLTLAMALNLDAAGLIRLKAIVPTFGNATLPAEMLVAHQITRVLKGRKDIPIAPGATGPAAQIFNPTATWFDDKTVAITGREGSFRRSCTNQGVDLMRDTLMTAGAEDQAGPAVTILAIGPLTDVACLLETAPKRAIRNIKEIIVLASRLEGESLQVNGKVVNDFNFRMDPIGGTILLAASEARQVPIRLISFALSGQTSQTNKLFGFNSSTYPGRIPPTPASRASFRWLLKAAAPRNEYWKSIFGTIEGPFDQYTLTAAIKPNLFRCRAGRAYVQMCPYPAWSLKYPTDADGNPTEEPYNRPNNPCTDHGTANGSALSEVPAQLVVTTDLTGTGRLVRGRTGIDGNIPALKNVRVRPVTVCTDFASRNARTQFENFLKRWTW
jgi:hypothetical protein